MLLLAASLGVALGAYAQEREWDKSTLKSKLLQRSGNTRLSKYGLDIEDGGNSEFVIHNNLEGNNQQVLYLGHQNSKTIFGISTSTDKGNTFHPRLSVENNGRVFIGEKPSVTTYKLAVDGTILSEEIIVDVSK